MVEEAEGETVKGAGMQARRMMADDPLGDHLSKGRVREQYL